MSVVYERTGGFAGVRQRLEVEETSGALQVTDRHTGETRRTLDPTQLQTLRSLVTGVEGQPPPHSSPEAQHSSDTFTVRLWLSGSDQPRVTLSTLAVPLGEGEGSPWGRLLSFVDGLLTAGLEQTRPAGAPQILSAADLDK
ncbi:MAG: hypothetical protein M3Y59_24905 [Myxococcota bacterium]|nr:hypothetical protein [Myxococcota bacterium]